MNKKLIITILFVGLLSSCFTQENNIPDSLIKKDKSLIIVIRPGKAVGRAYSFPIGVDNMCIEK